MGTDKIPWATFKKKLTEQFDYAHHQYNAWVAIRFLKYNTADDYINKFKRLAFKLPKMGEEDKKFDFLMNLPGHLQQKILGEKCKTLDDMCLLLWEYERVAKSSHYKAQLVQSFLSFRSGFHHNNNQLHQHRRSSSVSHIAKSTGPTPMDLDAVDVSKARCYNCNKIGHLSKDCQLATMTEPTWQR
jgi:hypothetical protein